MATFLTLGTIAIMPPFIIFMFLFGIMWFGIYYRVYFRQTQLWKRSNIPFLQPTFLLGHKYFSSLTKYSQVVAIDRIYKENQAEDLIAFFLGTIPLILVRDPTLIVQIFSKNFSKALGTGFEAPAHEVELYNMVNSTADIATWKFGRNVLAPIFSISRLEVGGFDKIKKPIDNLRNHVAKIESSGQPLNINEVAFNFIIDSNSLLNFGEDSDSYKEKGVIYQVVRGFFQRTFFKLMSLYALMILPCSQAFESLRFISRRNFNALAALIRKQSQSREQSVIAGDDLVDIFNQLNNSDVPNKDGHEDADTRKDNAELNMRKMSGLSMAVTLAGTEVVSTISIFAIHLLSLYPECQDKARREINEVMKKHNVSELNFDVIQDLQFLKQCLLETLRIYPTFPFIMRTISEDFRIPDTEYILKKGDRVIVSPYSIHHDVKHFSNPKKFYPERFDPKNGSISSSPTYMGFSYGPRKCPGAKLGLALTATFVASLLLEYEIRPRSHWRQMDATDFHPRGMVSGARGELFFDIVRCKI